MLVTAKTIGVNQLKNMNLFALQFKVVTRCRRWNWVMLLGNGPEKFPDFFVRHLPAGTVTTIS